MTNQMKETTYSNTDQRKGRLFQEIRISSFFRIIFSCFQLWIHLFQADGVDRTLFRSTDPDSSLIQKEKTEPERAAFRWNRWGIIILQLLHAAQAAAAAAPCALRQQRQALSIGLDVSTGWTVLLWQERFSAATNKADAD